MNKGFLVVILAICLQAAAFAQDINGRIIGTISDINGAIPNATIVIKDNQTGKERTITGKDDGTFEVSQLEFGTYTVTISASGYKTFTAENVKIDVGREFSLKAVLEVGQITEQVTITAEGIEQINSTNAELTTTVSEKQIRELPLNGRNPLNLISLQAGANPTTDSINGQRSSSTTVTRDGVNVQDNLIRTGAFVSDQPTTDDTGEFTLVTQNAGVQQGGGSSQVQLVTPRGGRDFHGSLYAFNRNSYFAANSVFNKQTGIERAFLNRNQFGGSISGPLPIFNFGEGGPMFLKNKAFFFFNYEGFRLAQQVTASGTTLLPQSRNGDFTYLDTVTGQLRTVNVLTGAGLNLAGNNLTVFNNAGGVLSVDPIIQSEILNQLPTSGNGTTTGINFLQTVSFLRGNPETRNAVTGRFDLDINDRNAVNFVYKWNKNLDARTEAGYSTGFSPVANVNQGGPTTLYNGSYRYSPTSNFSNEFRAAAQFSSPFFFSDELPPYIIGVPLVTNPQNSYTRQGRDTTYYTLQDNAVYTIGNHSLRFGGAAEFYKFDLNLSFGTTPQYNITDTVNPNTPGLETALLPGSISATDLARANSLRFLLAGIIGSGSVSANLVSREQGYVLGAPLIESLNFNIYSAYINDQWRIRPNFTLNLGLRYEYYTPLENPEGLFLETVIPNPNDLTSITSPNGVTNYVGTNVGRNGRFFNPDKNNFAPSVSFAYSPRFETGLFSKLLGGGTVLRGGFRLTYINDEYVAAPEIFLRSNQGLGTATAVARGSNGDTRLRATLSPRLGFEALPTFTTPTFVAPPRSFETINAEGGFLGGVYGIDPNYKMPEAYEWNFGIQRDIGFNTVLEVRYVGSSSNTLIGAVDYNEINYPAGYLEDFIKAQQNCRLQGATRPGGATAFDPGFLCTSAAYNPAIAGSQPLTVFNQLGGAGFLTNATVRSFIQQGRPGSLAQFYVQNGVQGNLQFQATDEIFSAIVLQNTIKYRYNALQAEIRRRFSDGLSFQANYTFGKVLANSLADDQNRFQFFQDNDNPGLNYGRADYDRTHTVNINAIYELPFGRGKKFLNQGGLLNAIFGGWQVTSIVNLSSGVPINILDARSTLATTGKSGRQSATSSLTADELRKLTGIFHTPNGTYFFNPSILYATASNGTVSQRVDLTQPLPAGFTLVSVRAASPINVAPFEGQVFFFNKPGETGNLPRNFLNSTPYYNWDAGLSKNFRLGETMRLQFRVEAFNVLNSRIPALVSDISVDSNFFGRIDSNYSPRIFQFGARFDF
jgi:hypothetical protein